MKKLVAQISAFVLTVMPTMAIAASFTGGDSDLDNFLQGIAAFIQGTIVPVLLAVAFLVFIAGIVQYFLKPEEGGNKREEGKNLIMYGIAGFVAIVSIWGIVGLIAGGLGLNDESLETVPKIPTIGS